MAAVMLDEALDGDVVDLGPATAVALGLLGAALAANAWLIRAGHEPLTSLLRSPQGRAFTDHLLRHRDRMLVFDLYSIGGSLVSRIPRRNHAPRIP